MNPTSFRRLAILPIVALALLNGCHQEHELPNEPAPPTAVPAIVSAEKTSFDQVTAKLDKGGNFYLYLSTAQVLGGLSEKMNAASNFFGSLDSLPADNRENILKGFNFFKGLVQNSGVEEISGLGASSIAREPHFYYSKVVVHHYPGQNGGLLWSAFGKSPRPLDELNLLPENTAWAVFSDLDVPLVWTNITAQVAKLNAPEATRLLEQWPAQFRKLTGLNFDEVLASLGGDYGIILTLDPEKKITLPIPNMAMDIPSPGFAIVAKVKSDVIFDRVDTVLKNNPMMVKVDQAGLKMRTFAIPMLPFDLRPSLARNGDYLFLATSDALIQEIVAVKAGHKKGFRATEQFKKMSQGMPDEGNNFTLVTREFGQVLADIQRQGLANNKGMSQTQAHALSQAFGGSTNTFSYSVGANGPEGWEGFANGSQDFQALLLPAAAGIGGLVAAIAIPNFVKARETAQYNQILNNLRRLDAAKQQWALENKKEAADTMTMDDLKPYGGTVQPVAGEEYLLHPVNEAPTARLTRALQGHPVGAVISLPQ